MMFEGLRKKIGTRQLRSEYRNMRRTPKVFNLATAQSVAIIYRCDNEEKFAAVKKYIRHLKEEEGIKRLMALGYVEDKVLPEFARSQLEFDFFCKADITWNFRPGGNAVKNFCNETFDILIDLEREEIIPLRHILNRSKGRFKVGYYTEEFKHFYDLMIDVRTPELMDYIAQVNHYLSIINKVS
jgi:hypothetical protein